MNQIEVPYWYYLLLIIESIINFLSITALVLSNIPKDSNLYLSISDTHMV